jgi:hypothetical protein
MTATSVCAASQQWADLARHKGIAEQVSSVMRQQLDRVAAGVGATEIAR